MSIVVYLVRHGEVEHHRTDVSLTPRGRAQAEAAGAAFTGRIADGDTVSIQHSSVTRVQETAELLHVGLASTLAAAGRAERILISRPGPDVALCNVRFCWGQDQEPQEPSLLYAQINTPAYLQSVLPARADFYRGFWASRDPMGYWLTHDSAGAAETSGVVWARIQERLRNVFDEDASHVRAHWIGVTHSGSMRVVLREAFGVDPGEPDFCEVIVIEPTGDADYVRLTHRDRSAPLLLPTKRTAPAR